MSWNDEMLEQIQKNKIPKDGKFSFRCTQCGKCCTTGGVNAVMISPFDLFRIAKYLNKQPAEVAQQYCTWYVGSNSHIPIIVLKMKNNVCPFLKDSQCSIQKQKPTVCALYPLGRYSSVNGEIGYFVQDIICGACDEEQTIADWMQNAGGLEESEKWFAVWNQAVTPMATSMRTLLVKDLSYDLITTIEQRLLLFLYLDYDISKDFFEQFAANSTKCNEMLTTIIKMLSGEVSAP